METSKESTPCIPPEKNSLLISEVKKFPSLYDTSDPNYYVLAERNKAWLQVAENCDLPADLCHMRWKSLRKRYAKEKRRILETLQGHRRPWALFPRMSFLTPSTSKRREKPGKSKSKVESHKLPSTSPDNFKHVSEDDMLIVDHNNEIVHTCKSVDMSEEDEYIYETLDDPDIAVEIMKKRNPSSKITATAIHSAGPTKVAPPIRYCGSGRIRKLTPKMQNSIIAKKLKHAQQILQQSNFTNHTNKKPTALQKVMIENRKITSNKATPEKNLRYSEKTLRHVATVNPNIVRVERTEEKSLPTTNIHIIDTLNYNKDQETAPSERKQHFKVIKVKGRNPIIFSPDKLSDIQSFLKSDQSPIKNPSDVISPLIKVKSVDNLNNQDLSSSSTNAVGDNNLDIIHSVGLVRKNTAEKSTGVENMNHAGYSRSYSWNRPTMVKIANKQTTTENIQPDSQTNDFEIEETWNDIKEENIHEQAWTHVPEPECHRQHEETVSHSQEPENNRANRWDKLYEAKLDLVAYQRRLLEEQHKKNLEYMKKEHDLKMTLLKAEIDLKRKQLNIML